MTESSYTLNNEFTSRTERTAELGDQRADTHQQPMTDRVAQVAYNTIDRMVETATPQIERMEGALVGATGQMKEQARHLREKGDQWTDDFRLTIRQNPLSAVVAAMAIGALIARITR